MTRKLVLAVLVVVSVCFVSNSAVLAENTEIWGLLNLSDDYDTVYLVRKNPETWEPLPGRAKGALVFDTSAPMFCFTFYGHKLVPEMKYTLIYQPDPWPGAGLICLGSAIASKRGTVVIKNCEETNTDLPAKYDLNVCPDAEYGLVGAKMWLVPTDDVKCSADGAGPRMLAWNPHDILFEYDRIAFDDTEQEATEPQCRH
jgi:hypothetical protein